MGYDVHLEAKTRNEEILHRIFLCRHKRENLFFTRDFSMFQSRNFEGCEMEQVGQILEIDLSVLDNYPVNYLADTGRLKYDLYLAEESQDFEKAKKIKREIEKTEEDWDKNYFIINDGWTKLEELRIVINELILKINQNPNFGQGIIVAEGWDFVWGNYFSADDSEILSDLEIILGDLDCFEKEGIEYVAFIGS